MAHLQEKNSKLNLDSHKDFCYKKPVNCVIINDTLLCKSQSEEVNLYFHLNFEDVHFRLSIHE